MVAHPPCCNSSGLSKCQGQFPTTVLNHLKKNVSIAFFHKIFKDCRIFFVNLQFEMGLIFVWCFFFPAVLFSLLHLQSKKQSPKYPRLLAHLNGWVVLQLVIASYTVLLLNFMFHSFLIFLIFSNTKVWWILLVRETKNIHTNFMVIKNCDLCLFWLLIY